MEPFRNKFCHVGKRKLVEKIVPSVFFAVHFRLFVITYASEMNKLQIALFAERGHFGGGVFVLFIFFFQFRNDIVGSGKRYRGFIGSRRHFGFRHRSRPVAARKVFYVVTLVAVSAVKVGVVESIYDFVTRLCGFISRFVHFAANLILNAKRSVLFADYAAFVNRAVSRIAHSRFFGENVIERVMRAVAERKVVVAGVLNISSRAVSVVSAHFLFVYGDFNVFLNAVCGDFNLSVPRKLNGRFFDSVSLVVFRIRRLHIHRGDLFARNGRVVPHGNGKF